MDKGKSKYHSVRAPQQNKFSRSAFAETYPDTYESTYQETYSETYSGNDELEVIPPDIFDADHIDKTTWHVHTQAESPFYGLSADDMELVDAWLDEIKFIAEISPGSSEYSFSDENGSLTITKASDPLSEDTHLSYNKAVLEVNGIHIEWYFKIDDDGKDVKDADMKNIQKDPGKAEILFEKSEANKVEGYNRNNTGYKFWWSDGRVMDHGDVETFIKTKKKEGDQRFIDDFPKVQPGEQPPTYTIKGLKQPYYAFSENLPDPLSEGGNLKSDLLRGNSQLQSAYDGRIYIGPSSKGESVVLIKKALNQIYTNSLAYTQLAETESYDNATQAAVKKIQVDYNLKDKSGIVGDETLKRIDEILTAPPPITYTWTGPSQTQTNPTDFQGMVVGTASGGLPLYSGPIPAQTVSNQENIKGAIEETNKYDQQSDWDQRVNNSFLATVAGMSDMDMGALDFKERMKMIRAILGFVWVDGNAETTLLRLLRTVPPNEAADLETELKANNNDLLKKFESKMHGGNYHEYHTILRDLMWQLYSPTQAAFQMQSLYEWSPRTIPWCDPGFIKNVTSPKIVYNVKLGNDGLVHITWITQKPILSTKPEFSGPLNDLSFEPFQMIGLRLQINEAHLGQKEGAKNNIYVMPAINMLDMENKQLNQAIGDALTIGSFAIGIGELSAASTLLRTILGGADVIFAAGNLAVNSYQYEIASTPAGQEFLSYWHTANQMMAIYGITRLAIEAPMVVKNLKTSWTKYKTSGSNTTIPTKSIDEIDATVNKLDEAGEGADFENLVQKGGKNSKWESQYWTKNVEFEGRKVYQRDDLIDPNFKGTDGKTNLERMQSGLAPIGPDGKSIELHHMLQTDPGPIAEVTSTFHREYFDALHINIPSSEFPSGIDRNIFGAWRKQYWKFRANDFVPSTPTKN